MIAIFGYIAMVAAMVLAIYRAPVTAMAPIMCMFGFEQWAEALIPFFSRNNVLNNLLLGVLVLFALTLMLWRGRNLSLNYTKTGVVVFLLLAYSLLSLLWSPRTEGGMMIWSDRVPYIVTILILGPLLITKFVDLRHSCWSVLLFGSPLVVMILTLVNWEGRGVVLAGSDYSGNPLAVSQMAGYVALAAIFLPRVKNVSVFGLLRWGLVVLCMMVIVKSGSRGQFFGVLLVSAFFLLFASPSKGLRGAFSGTIGLGVLLVAGGWAFTNFAETSRWDADEIVSASEGRWQPAVTLLKEAYSSPETFVFGLGNSASFEILGYYPHVVPAEILGEEGVVGFILYLIIIFFALRSLIRAYNLVKFDELQRGALLTLGGWFCYELFLSFKQGSMLGTSLLLFLFAIILTKYEDMARQKIYQQKSQNRLSVNAWQNNRFPGSRR